MGDGHPQINTYHMKQNLVKWSFSDLHTEKYSDQVGAQGTCGFQNTMTF